MKVIKLAEIFAAKYKIITASPQLETTLRNKIKMLWNYPNKLFPIIRMCAEAGVSKPNNEHEKKAVHGYKFCKELVNIINYLQSNWLNIGLGEMREALLQLVNIINSNLSDKDSTVQFPGVSALIFEIFPISKKYSTKIREEQQARARTGLSRILSFATEMIKDLRQLEVMFPEKFTHESKIVDINQELPERFSPQRAQLSNYDIIDFIRQHGDEYGISSKEDWETVFKDDPEFKNEITTVINALNRGHYPKDAAVVKTQIADILQRHRQKQQNNAHFFEQTVQEA